MKLYEVRRYALTLPGATEHPHFEKSSFRVGGKIFATVPQGGRSLNVFVDEHEVRASVAEDPVAFEEPWWGKRLAGVRVNVRNAPRDVVFELLAEAWKRKAPRRLIAELDTRARG